VTVAFDPEFQGKFSMAVLRVTNAMQTEPPSPEGFFVAGLEDASMRGGL
jgi:hypothetical protein